jgi:hypothetical protein
MEWKFKHTLSGVAVTDLVKADVVLKATGTATVLTYTDLTNDGYGNYTCTGITFGLQGVDVYIKTTLTYSNVALGDPYILTKDLAAGSNIITGLKASTANGQALRYEDKATFMQTTGTQTVAGVKTFTSNPVFASGSTFNINSSGSGDLNFPKAVYSDGYIAPQDDAEFTTKKFVNDEVAKIIATPFQQALTRVRVIVGGTATAGDVYLTVAQAIAYFGSPSINKQCIVEISSTGITTEFVTVSHASLVPYVHLKGDKHINMIFGVTGASTTCAMTITGLTIYMGANAYDITTDRTYNGFTFENCNIYAYKNLTLTNCVVNNCKIFQPAGYGVTVSGTTQIDSSTMIMGACEGTVKGIGFNEGKDRVNLGYSMPVDPSSSGT